jgi:hypothetical protein
MSTDLYPSVTIVAGRINPTPGPSGAFGHMLRMHGGATYIHINPETARQWIGVLEQIAEPVQRRIDMDPEYTDEMTSLDTRRDELAREGWGIQYYGLISSVRTKRFIDRIISLENGASA